MDQSSESVISCRITIIGMCHCCRRRPLPRFLAPRVGSLVSFHTTTHCTTNLCRDDSSVGLTSVASTNSSFGPFGVDIVGWLYNAVEKELPPFASHMRIGRFQHVPTTHFGSGGRRRHCEMGFGRTSVIDSLDPNRNRRSTSRPTSHPHFLCQAFCCS